jgi:YidC/Oxa1 family membrane protein insertase
MFDLIGSTLAWFYSIIPSYGVSIILLTLLVMAVVTPFTIKGTKSMLQMQRLQPELKKIQARYKDDREKMNQELMAFYKANNINPIGGCLPLVIQMPVFFVLYRVVRGLTHKVTDVGLHVGQAAAQLRPGGSLTYFNAPPRTFSPDHISTSSQMYQDLSKATEMKFLGMDLAESASKALGTSLVHALPYLVLIAIVAVTGFVQQRQIQGRSGAAQGNSQQQAIMKILPFFLPVFSFTLPGALVLYFVVSNTWRIGQQSFITRTMYSGEHALGVQAQRARENAALETTATDVEEKPAPKPKKAEPAAAPRSAMGRNRREGGDKSPPRRAPRTPKKPSDSAPPRTSSRVTPPGQAPRPPKKKRNT